MHTAHLGLDIHEPPEDLLVGQPVQRPCQAVHAGAEAVVRVRQGAAHQVGRVRADVATLGKCGLGLGCGMVKPLATKSAGSRSGWGPGDLRPRRIRR